MTKKNGTTIDGLIKECDNILGNESNARFWIEAKFLKNTLEEVKKNPVKDSNLKIVGETNSLIDLSKELKKGEFGECITCDRVDFMLVDLAQDNMYAEVMDQVIPRSEKERPEALIFNKMDDQQFEAWLKKPSHKRGK